MKKIPNLLASTIKLKSIRDSSKLVCLSLSVTYTLVNILQGRAGAYPSKAFDKTPLIG